MNMLKRVLTGLVVGGLMSANVAISAYVNIGYVDVNSGIENTQAYQKGKLALDKLRTKLEKELSALRDQIVQGQNEFRSQQLTMSTERRYQKENELKELTKSFQRKSQDAEEEWQKSRSSLGENVAADFFKAAEQYGKDNQFDLVIPKSNTIYVNSAFDITDEVVKLVDKKK